MLKTVLKTKGVINVMISKGDFVTIEHYITRGQLSQRVIYY